MLEMLSVISSIISLYYFLIFTPRTINVEKTDEFCSAIAGIPTLPDCGYGYRYLVIPWIISPIITFALAYNFCLMKAKSDYILSQHNYLFTGQSLELIEVNLIYQVFVMIFVLITIAMKLFIVRREKSDNCNRIVTNRDEAARKTRITKRAIFIFDIFIIVIMILCVIYTHNYINNDGIYCKEPFNNNFYPWSCIDRRVDLEFYTEDDVKANATNKSLLYNYILRQGGYEFRINERDLPISQLPNFNSLLSDKGRMLSISMTWRAEKLLTQYNYFGLDIR